jgi:hypothetical protein
MHTQDRGHEHPQRADKTTQLEAGNQDLPTYLPTYLLHPAKKKTRQDHPECRKINRQLQSKRDRDGSVRAYLCGQ